MIALDTNILVRYIVHDDTAQAAAATRVIERECTSTRPGWIDAVVLCELVWVLESAYDYTRIVVVEVLRTLLTSAELRVESPQIAWAALQAYQIGTADYADCLIGLCTYWSGSLCSICRVFSIRFSR